MASLCVKTKKGLIRKEDTSSVIQAVQPITLDKHELHSTWPVYNQPDTHAGERDGLRAKLRRERYCFAPGDKMRIKVIVSSNRVEPAKLKSVAVTIKETVTFHGVKPNRKSLTSNSSSSKPSMQRVEVVTQKAKSIGKKLYKGDSKDFDLECVIPKQQSLMSISTAKHIEVSYTIRVYVDISKAPIVIDHVPMLMTTFPRQNSLGIMKKIGFVEGLSERELLIDDDYDASSTQGVSRSARPIPQRSLSYSGSTSTGYSNPRLNRRDTVMTNTTATGPGMAGLGVPGQLFNFAPGGYGTPSPFGYSNEAPRPAFAGPPRIIESDEALSASERAAMFHHSYAPSSARAMGVDYEAVAGAGGLEAVHSQNATEYLPQRASYAGPATISAPPTRPATASQAAELEKERLYERARQQAERNQRRAAQAQAQAQGSVQQGTPNLLPAAEQEKLRLWERARREAEAYQQGFSEGVTFPQEETSSTPQRAQSQQALRPSGMTPLNITNNNETRRGSGMFWLDSPEADSRGAHEMLATTGGSSSHLASSAQPYPTAPLNTTGSSNFLSAEEEKKRLYEQAKAERDSYVQAQGSSPPSQPASQSAEQGSSAHTVAPQPQTNALTEKEQMARYYAAQDAVSEYQQQASSSSGPSGTAAASSSQAISEPKSSSVAATANAAPTEKEQLARYYAAQDEVNKFQRNQDSNAPPPQSSAVLVNGQRSSTPPPSFEASTAASGSTAPNASTEKEQMRKYYEARDQEIHSPSQPSGSGSNQRHSMFVQHSHVASPRPQYAPNFQHSLASSSPRSTPLPQGAFSSSQPNGKPRVVSHTPTSQHRQQSTSGSGLPSISMLSIQSPRGSTPNPMEGPWAPKVASSSWEADEQGVPNGPPIAPPPLPPKTPLSTNQ